MKSKHVTDIQIAELNYNDRSLFNMALQSANVA